MIILHSSYPKSGSMCVIAIITSLVYSEDGIFNFDILNENLTNIIKKILQRNERIEIYIINGNNSFTAH